MTLKITEPDKKKIITKRLIFKSFILLLSVVFLYNGNDAVFAPIYIGLLFLWLAANFYGHFIIMPFKVVGEIKLQRDYIVIFNKTYNILEINKIGIVYHSIHGESASLTGFNILFGDKNIFQIETNEGEILKKTFFLESKVEVRSIIKYLEFYKENNIGVQFYSKRQKKYYF